MRSVSCASVVFFLFMNCSQGTTQDIQNYQPLIHPLHIYQPQPVSFYPPVTQHLSALDPSFIQPLSFYPSVTQHLSALAALDPPFIHPLSNLYPSTHPSPSIYQPLIHPLSDLYPSTHPSPSIYQPLIHPLSNLCPTFFQPLSF